MLNRRALFQRFGEDDVIAGLAVIMFDLDYFKQINDSQGHAQGDLVLQQFADVLRRELRHSDVIARLGGEEFCAILPGRDRDADAPRLLIDAEVGVGEIKMRTP